MRTFGKLNEARTVATLFFFELLEKTCSQHVIKLVDAKRAEHASVFTVWEAIRNAYSGGCFADREQHLRDLFFQEELVPNMTLLKISEANKWCKQRKTTFELLTPGQVEEMSKDVYFLFTEAWTTGRTLRPLHARYQVGLKTFEEAPSKGQCTSFVELLDLLMVHLKTIDDRRSTVSSAANPLSVFGVDVAEERKKKWWQRPGKGYALFVQWAVDLDDGGVSRRWIFISLAAQDQQTESVGL